MGGACQILNGSDFERNIRDVKSVGGFWSTANSAYLESPTVERARCLEPKIRAWEQRLRPEARFQCTTSGCRALTS